MINQRNIKKTAIPFPGEVSAKWTSKYGSVTISQAREEAGEGINEMGLAIVSLALENEGKYPDIDNKPMVDNFQWIQYMLDNCSTLNEVITASKSIRISNQSVPYLHYVIADAKGNYAFAAYINKELKFYTNDKSTGNFISNDCFTRSAVDLKEYEGFGGTKKSNSQYQEFSSKEAVVMGATMIKEFDSKKEL
jgi:choloylglycine hydrolase